MKKRSLLLVVLFVLLAGGLAWALLPERADPEVARVVELQEKLFEQNSEWPPEERREGLRELRGAIEKLSPEQRDELMKNGPPPPMRLMQRRVTAFFELPEEQRAAALDQQIDEMEERRQRWEQRRAERDADGRDGRGRFGPNIDPARANEFRRRMLDHTSPEQRAMFGEYMRQLQTRRQQRGLPPLRGPFGR